MVIARGFRRRYGPPLSARLDRQGEQAVELLARARAAPLVAWIWRTPLRRQARLSTAPEAGEVRLIEHVPQRLSR